MRRYFTHLTHSRFAIGRAFPETTLAAIEAGVREVERTHAGQIRFAVEAALDWRELRAGVDARSRAVDVFSLLRVWDTEQNNGVLIYVLLADRDVEIVSDRGIHGKVKQEDWEQVCRAMEAHFRDGRFQDGAVEGIKRVGNILTRHFPPASSPRNELPDWPELL